MEPVKVYTVEVDGKLPYSSRGRLVVSSKKVAEKAARRLQGKVLELQCTWQRGKDSGLCWASTADGFTEFWTEWRGEEEHQA